jgi:hypothetical protein
MEAERRALVVLAELEAPVLRRRLVATVHVHVLDLAAELAHALDSGLEVINREEDVGVAPASPPCIPPGVFGVSITKPSPEGPGSKSQPNRPS